MPMTGAHRRHTPAARSVTPTVTIRVTSVLTVAAAGAVPAGTSVSMPNMIGMRVTGMSMITVPHTVGVKIRRSSDSRVASANWNSEEMTMSVERSPGPPFSSAVTLTAMKAADVPISSTWPEPTRPTRTACSTVVTPLITSAANTAQDRKPALPPAARTTMAGVSTMPATLSMANWKPRPRASAGGGCSSGS